MILQLADSKYPLPAGASGAPPASGAKGVSHPLNTLPVKADTPIVNFPR